jgi:hypothetical protein
MPQLDEDDGLDPLGGRSLGHRVPMSPASPIRRVVGERVELHSRFDDSWSQGFEIAEVLPVGYRVRRTYDDTLLPDMTGGDDIRAARIPAPWGSNQVVARPAEG